eukprot:CAMPEP_0172473606 /NCGR_PEP_ID=MMETSP1065-20121228/68941_1 /TAXON_ID=265537 /ORGANISM="Amphiprora paludosa, Strain CCMP125" /LENGTH=546 /DNA_ID=CAMNT_0013231781 /DNA_START=200 /DNA_END=1840 /DNA_ORIENTATION=+
MNSTCRMPQPFWRQQSVLMFISCFVMIMALQTVQVNSQQATTLQAHSGNPFQMRVRRGTENPTDQVVSVEELPLLDLDQGEEQVLQEYIESYEPQTGAAEEESIPFETEPESTVPHGSLLDDEEELPSLFPLIWTDYLGFTFAVAGLILAAGGGIGGGGILVPCYILLLEFPVKHAIPLASATVLGGAIANNILNWPKRHPEHADRGCIDWDLILLMEPMTMAGTLVGANLNEFLPEIVLVLMLLILLGLTAYKTLQKATKMYHKESEEMRKQVSLALGTASETMPLKKKSSDLVPADVAPIKTTSSYNNKDSIPHLEVMNRQETLASSSWAKRKVLMDVFKLAVLFVVVTAMNLLKGDTGEGGTGFFALPYCGSACFWFTEAAILTVIVLFTIYARHSILVNLREGLPITSDIAWSESNTVTYSLLAIVAGLVAGLFGVGGGIIKGPLMLGLGVHPAVASATSAAMIFFTSSTSTASYSVFGLLLYDYAAFCFLVGLISTFVGQLAMNRLMKKYNRNSYIAYSIGFVVGLSAICMSVEAFIALFE